VSFIKRLGALGWFLLAAAWFLSSDLVAMRAASGLTFGDFYEPLYRIFLLFLLILGYSLMSRLARRSGPRSQSLGLERRPGWLREWALGAALGWAGVVACVLPAALIGSLVVTVFGNSHQLWVALYDLIALAAGTLAIEVAFRGFALQRLVDAMGPATATLFMASIFAIWRTHAGPTTTAAVVVSFLLGWVLALAALRTRALWVSWGFHFAWVTVMGMLFGLPVAGGLSYSPVFVTNASGPGWITGNLQGPEGSAFGVIVGFLLLIAMVRATGELHHKYGHPEIVAGGIPIDIDAAARRQHEEAMAHAEPPPPPLVQILPVTSYAPPVRNADTPAEPASAAGEETRAPEETSAPPADGPPASEPS
jgi:hypothetical protein